MRIISGLLKSRIIRAPGGNRTHPMSEKARGAIFNMLGDIEGLEILDAYAGSGSLSIEAISRGAKHAVAIDIDKKAYKTLTENIETVGLDQQIHATRANASTWAKNNDELFDIVFLDPPYNDISPDHIYTLAKKVKVGGLVVLSIPDHFKPRLDADIWQIVSQKSYAAANVMMIRRLS